jgi:uncharacterized protein YgbK (DUF1537 family)
VLHYKVCSTLDSSPEIGSIGLATEIALQHFASDWVPVLLAAPQMRRYQAFGHLFASAPGGVFRLDRHPIMARHPITPMDEADVAAHLRKQTSLPIALVDLEALRDEASALSKLTMVRAQGAKLISLDGMDADTQAEAGRLMWQQRGERLLAVGSQGVEYALVAHWQRAGMLPGTNAPFGTGAADRILAVSGSVSSITAAQIQWALANGFAGIRLDIVMLESSDAPINRAIDEAFAALQRGNDVVIYSALGPDDPALAAYRGSPHRIGLALGMVLRRVHDAVKIGRVAVLGGDTSGAAAQALSIAALTPMAPIAPGAGLCTAYSDDPGIDGLEIAMKGGQMGTVDYLGRVRAGG